MNSSKSDVRFPFSRQPAHCLIIDLTSNFNEEVLQQVCDGISRFFTVVCSMSSGPNRIPYFCMLVTTPYTEIMFPAQRLTKSSYCKIEDALSEIRKTVQDGNVQKSCKSEFKPIEHAIRDATSQFQRIKQSAGSLTKIELTVIMCYTIALVKKGLAEALSKVNLTDILHVNALCLLSATKEHGDFEALGKSKEMYDDDITDNLVDDKMLDLTGILDISRVDCDSLSIESVMRNWLNDRSIDREHLHLCFNTPGRENGLVIKCVIRERLLDFAELPYRQAFEIALDGSDSLLQNQNAGRASSKPTSPTPITLLRAIKRVLCSSLCESVLFGKPLIISSSNCWQMEWDELELNQNHFNALCRSLIDTKQAIILENLTPASTHHGGKPIKRPVGLFVVMASENLGSLLLKGISSQEFLLSSPVPLQSQWDVVPKEAMDKLNVAMHCLEFEPHFNPLLTKSGLIGALKANFKEEASHRNTVLSKKFASNQTQAYSSGHENQINRSGSFHNQSNKPTTGKAARFVAPRQEQASASHSGKSKNQRNVPTISLALKPRASKAVTFPDFPDF